MDRFTGYNKKYTTVYVYLGLGLIHVTNHKKIQENLRDMNEGNDGYTTFPREDNYVL